MRKEKFNNNKFFNPGEKTLEDKFPARGIHDLINAARNVLGGGGVMGTLDICRDVL